MEVAFCLLFPTLPLVRFRISVCSFYQAFFQPLQELPLLPANIPLHFVDETQIKQEYVNQSVWLEMSGFVGQPGTHCLIPSADGELARVLVGKPAKFDTWTLAELARSLPAQKYELADEFSAEIATKLCLGWVLGQYRFTRYKQTDAGRPARTRLSRLRRPAIHHHRCRINLPSARPY